MAIFYSTLLGRIVSEGPWTIEETCAAFERTAREMGEDATLSPRQLVRWMKGDVGRPRPVARRVAERFWSRPFGELLGPAVLPVPAPTPTADPVAVLKSSDATWEEIVARQSMDFATRARRYAMDPTVLDELEVRLRRIAADYIHSPDPRTRFQELVAVRDRAFRQIESERPRPDQSRQLHELAGAACALLAQSTHELGFRRAAMSHAHAAYVCAEIAGFASLQVWIRATQAAIAEYAGQPMEAVRYAAAGQSIESRGTAAVRLMSLAANGHARLGNLAAAQEALNAATRARDAASADDRLDEIGGVFTVSLAKQHAYAASALALLNQGPASIASATQALDLYQGVPAERRQPVNEAYAHIDVAIGRVLGGELDGVEEALEPVLTLPVDARVDLFREKLGRVHRKLSEGVSGALPSTVRTAQERIETFVGAAVAELP